MMQFSVLIPVYSKENPENFDLALQSIFNQTLIPNECVIVEDGPVTLEIKNILKKYTESHPSILKIYSLPINKGMGYAMDFGLHKCTHDWIARADSDDINKPNRFEIQLNFLKSNPNVDVLGSYIQEFVKSPGDIDQFRKVCLSHNDIVKQMKFRNPINHMTVFFRKSKAIAAGGYWHKRVLEDYNLWYKLYKHDAIFANIDVPLVDARIGNNMVGRRRGYQYFLHEMEMFSEMQKDGFINLYTFVLTSGFRFILRLMPLNLLRVFYKKFLRG